METGQGNSAKVNLVSKLFVIHSILPVVFKEEEMDVNEFIICCLVKNDVGTNKWRGMFNYSSFQNQITILNKYTFSFLFGVSE